MVQVICMAMDVQTTDPDWRQMTGDRVCRIRATGPPIGAGNAGELVLNISFRFRWETTLLGDWHLLHKVT